MFLVFIFFISTGANLGFRPNGQKSNKLLEMISYDLKKRQFQASQVQGRLYLVTAIEKRVGVLWSGISWIEHVAKKLLAN